MNGPARGRRWKRTDSKDMNREFIFRNAFSRTWKKRGKVKIGGASIRIIWTIGNFPPVFLYVFVCVCGKWVVACLFFFECPGEETSSFLYILRGKFDTFFHSGNRWVVSFVSLGTKRRRKKKRYLRASPHVKIWIMSIVWSSRHILEFIHTAFSHTIAATIFRDKKILLSSRANEDRSFATRAFSLLNFPAP